VAAWAPNGGGKTTLLKLILGLLEPDRGRIRVLGRPPKQAAPEIGYVPQDVLGNRSFPVTVRDVVLMGRPRRSRPWKSWSGEDLASVRQALEQMEMWDFRDRRIGDLSGGQRQRVLVARALVSEPRILLLDEPTANFDTKGQSEFYNLLRELNRTITIVVVSHDLMVLSSHVRSVACVSGDVHFHDKPEITKDMLAATYHCPVELIAHGVPHRVFPPHEDDHA
jgi:zinc transport system ATP-binding protein